MTTRETGNKRHRTAAKERLLQAQYGWIDTPHCYFRSICLFVCLFVTHSATLRWWRHLQPGSAQLWPSASRPVRRNFCFQSGRLQTNVRKDPAAIRQGALPRNQWNHQPCTHPPRSIYKQWCWRSGVSLSFISIFIKTFATWQNSKVKKTHKAPSHNMKQVYKRVIYSYGSFIPTPSSWTTVTGVTMETIHNLTQRAKCFSRKWWEIII